LKFRKISIVLVEFKSIKFFFLTEFCYLRAV